MKKKKKSKKNQNSNVAKKKKDEMLMNLYTAVIADTLLKVDVVLHAW